MFHPQSAKPKGTLSFSNRTWQKVKLIAEAAAKGDAAHSSRNGERYSQRIFSPENVFCAPEDNEIIKMAFIATGQIRNYRINKVGRDLLDHQVQSSAHCNP